MNWCISLFDSSYKYTYTILNYISLPLFESLIQPIHSHAFWCWYRLLFSSFSFSFLILILCNLTICLNHKCPQFAHTQTQWSIYIWVQRSVNNNNIGKIFDAHSPNSFLHFFIASSFFNRCWREVKEKYQVKKQQQNQNGKMYIIIEKHYLWLIQKNASKHNI